MIQITLTISSGASLILNLPLCAEDVIAKSAPYYLAYGNVSVAFDTADLELNEALNGLVPKTINEGIWELNLLAYILEQMDEQRLALLYENLPEAPCEIEELTCYASYFCKHYLDSDGNQDPNATPLERYKFSWEQSAWEARLQRGFSKQLEEQRFTGGELFKASIDRARESGDFSRFEAICEYVLPDDREKGKLCSYEFDMLPVVSFGSSEGIYIDCSLRGKFNESGRSSVHIGTIKTLSTNLEACKTMGELCGTLLYHAGQMINENLYRFDSEESIKHMLTKPIVLVQTQSMDFPQM